MTKWEYETTTCAPEEIFDILNLEGSQGWEFVTLLMMQKLIENKFAVGQPPRTVMEFQLIFKRQKE